MQVQARIRFARTPAEITMARSRRGLFWSRSGCGSGMGSERVVELGEEGDWRSESDSGSELGDMKCSGKATYPPRGSRRRVNCVSELGGV